MERRNFFKVAVTASALLHTNTLLAKHKIPTKRQVKTTVAICGGGFGGLSTAKFLKELNPNLDVTIIEKNDSFFSCPFSNAWLGGLKNISLEELNFDYNSAINKYNYNFINDLILNIHTKSKTIYTQDLEIKYDYMIMAVGIEYNYKKLFKRDYQKAKEALRKAPPGLKPSNEHYALKRMIKNFKGGNFVLTIPHQTIKCPLVPYERACMIATYFMQNNIDGKVIIIDPRQRPAAKPKKFLQVFNTIYKDIIEYRNITRFKDVDFDNKIIYTEKFDKKELDYVSEQISFEEASIIPPNIANKLIKKAKLKTYVGGWAKLKEPTMRSISDDDVYIIGDAQGQYPYPKSAQMANSCAYIVAQDLTARFNNTTFDHKKNMPSNICYSMVSKNKAASVSHFYKYDKIINIESQTSKIDKQTAILAKNWYKGLTDDIFGL